MGKDLKSAEAESKDTSLNEGEENERVPVRDGGEISHQRSNDKIENINHHEYKVGGVVAQ